jgi:hypothetical protein
MNLILTAITTVLMRWVNDCAILEKIKGIAKEFVSSVCPSSTAEKSIPKAIGRFSKQFAWALTNRTLNSETSEPHAIKLLGAFLPCRVSKTLMDTNRVVKSRDQRQ